MNGLALCAGFGGLDAGLHLVMPHGYRTVCAVERQAYAAACLVAWMEKTPLGPPAVWDDITTFNPSPWRGVIDIVSATLPCQPHSVAGKRRGEGDERYLWPHGIRIIRGVNPPIVFGENVGQLISDGYQRIKRDLEETGYEVAEGIFTAAEVGSPHLRERLYYLGVLADTHSGTGHAGAKLSGREKGPNPHRSNTGPELANPEHDRCQGGNKAGLRTETVMPRSQTMWPWPAGKGREQYAWEHPRSIESSLGRTANELDTRTEQVYGIGNGVLPVVAAMAFVALWQKLKEHQPCPF